MNAPTRTTDERLESALGRLLAAGTLTSAQADALRREYSLAPAAGRPGWTNALAEVGGYVGAAFVFAAAVALTGPNWDSFSDATKVTTLLGPAVLMLVAAVAVALSAPGRWRPLAPSDGPRRRVVSALVVVGAVLAAGAVGVRLEDWSDGDAGVSLITLTALVVLAVGYAGCRSALLHVALAIAAVTEVFAVWAYVDTDGDSLVQGLLLTALAVAWAALSWFRVLAERALGLCAAAVFAFVGGETMALDSASGSSLGGYGIMVAAAVAALAAYVLLREVPLLVLGALGLAVTVPQAVIDWSDGALGAAGGLLVSGLSIVGASVLALRLRTETPTPA